MICLKHQDRQAVAVCAACGKPLCSECIVQYNDSVYCSEACQNKGEASKLRSADTIAVGKKIEKRSRKRFWITFIIIILLAGGGFWFYKNNKKSIDRKVSSGYKQVRKSASEAISEGKKAMPKDSRYKREREALVE